MLQLLGPTPKVLTVKNAKRQDGVTASFLREVSVEVPLCRQCRRDIKVRVAGVLSAGFAAGSLALALWYWDTPKLSYLPFGVVFAGIIFLVVAILLSCLFGPKQIAYLQPDGSDIAFANDEYQRMYSGESRPGREDDVHWGEVHWK